MRTLGLAVQVVLSLAVVLGLMWLLARALRGRAMASGAGVLEVLARTPMTRGSSVAVVRVADQVLVLGVTETQVTVLTVADSQQVVAAARIQERSLDVSRTNGRSRRFQDGAGPLAGSILSPESWRRVVATVKERTVRR